MGKERKNVTKNLKIPRLYLYKMKKDKNKKIFKRY
jgi:hypothetical protein